MITLLLSVFNLAHSLIHSLPRIHFAYLPACLLAGQLGIVCVCVCVCRDRGYTERERERACRCVVWCKCGVMRRF